MTTKDQEFKVLARIKKIVAELGEDSYIAAAFDGCFEIAEENIRNDFACSMKQRVDMLTDEYKSLSERNADLQASNDALHDRIDRLKEKQEQHTANSLTGEQRKQMISCLNHAIEQLNNTVDYSAQEIIKLADNPNSLDFQKAVANHRAAQETASEYVKLVQRLREIA